MASKNYFFCVFPATIEGGETPIADSRRVLKHINKEIVKEFESRNILYVRNYYEGIDLSWQEVFQTQNRHEVENFCNLNNINFRWLDGQPELRTEQIMQATLIHPSTDERVWFNQAHLFHYSNIDISSRSLLIQECSEENLPRNAYYGDGTPIPNDVLENIRRAYEKESIVFKWQAGDILLLDNILTAHGRKPFKGERKIAVAMCS